MMTDPPLLVCVTANPNIFRDMPIVRCVPVSAERILNLLAQGEALADIPEDDPDLEEDDVRARLAYHTREVIAHECPPPGLRTESTHGIAVRATSLADAAQQLSNEPVAVANSVCSHRHYDGRDGSNQATILCSHEKTCGTHDVEATRRGHGTGSTLVDYNFVSSNLLRQGNDLTLASVENLNQLYGHALDRPGFDPSSVRNLTRARTALCTRHFVEDGPRHDETTDDLLEQLQLADTRERDQGS